MNAPRGRAIVAGKGTADVRTLRPLVGIAGNVWAAAFKAHFAAFWIFANAHQTRISRLDPVQHAAIHDLNAATRLANSLDEGAALAVQRRALRDPCSDILTLQEASTQLGLPCVASRQNHKRGMCVADDVRALGSMGATSAAKLLCYARTAWVLGEVLIVDLGQRAANMQTNALRTRLRLDAATPLHEMPIHATHLCACAECKCAPLFTRQSAAGSPCSH